MFASPCGAMKYKMNDPIQQPQQVQSKSYFRIMHASPNAPDVDVYANGTMVAKNLRYKDFSSYWSAIPGNYLIEVYPTGEKTKPILSLNIPIPQGTIFNIAVIGTAPNVSLYPIPEPASGQNFGRPCIRFINLSPNSPAIDIITPDGKNIFSNVEYKYITDYACIPAGVYTFEVRPKGSQDAAFTLSGVKLDANNYYSIYALGLLGERPPLQAILVIEPRS